jgi:nicotinate phosphoribosyltransferase
MIINSLLETDLYKFTMGQVVLHQFPWVNVKYKFKCRNDIKWTEDHLARLIDEVGSFCTLRLTENEIEYLSGIRFFKSSYVDFLRLYQPNPKHFNAWLENGELNITVEGPWFLTIYWEVPLLAMISEIYCEREGVNYANCEEGWRKLKEKCEIAKPSGFKFVDFGSFFEIQWA